MADTLPPQVVDQVQGAPRVARADDAKRPLCHTTAEDLATGHERGEHDVADLGIAGKQAMEFILIDPKNAPGTGHSALHHRALAGQQTQLAEESSRAVRHDHRLRAAGVIDVDDLRRTFQDNDEAVVALTLAEERFAGPDLLRLAEVRQACQLGRGEGWERGRILGGADIHGVRVGRIVHERDGIASVRVAGRAGADRDFARPSGVSADRHPPSPEQSEQ